NSDFTRGIRQPFIAGWLVLPPSVELTSSSDSLLRRLVPEASMSGCLKSHTVNVGRWSAGAVRQLSPPSRVRRIPALVFAYRTKVRDAEAARFCTEAPIIGLLTFCHDWPPSSVRYILPVVSQNHATCGSSHANCIEVTVGLSQPSS